MVVYYRVEGRWWCIREWRDVESTHPQSHIHPSLNHPQMDLRTPKGTTDYPPKHALLYEELIKKTTNSFKVYGALPIDTPIFELKEILLNKYGEDTKLIYDLKEGDAALRYDLTVPFSRFMASNKLKRLRRYQIGKVFRRDQPSIAQGRLREFVQADFDIAGEGLPMVADSEALSCANRLLEDFGIGPFVIKISDRRILMSILEAVGVREEDFSAISSTIDKIDKLTREELIREFVSKGLSQQQVDDLLDYIRLSGREEVLDTLKKDKIYKIDKCREAVDQLESLLRYSKLQGYYNNLSISLSLARGLDYYTGLIIEANYEGSQTGSVLGGGRYDNLISGLTSSKNKVPCVGFSVGITRIFSLLIANYPKDNEVLVFVSSSGGLFLEERLAITSTLWALDIPTETYHTKRHNFKEHKDLCLKRGIKFLVVVGQEEMARGKLIVYDVVGEVQEEVGLEDLGKTILDRLAIKG